MICEACNGEGIVGAGERPIDKVGRLTTCGVCAGTGKALDESVEVSGSEIGGTDSDVEAPSFLGDSSEDLSESSEEGV